MLVIDKPVIDIARQRAIIARFMS